jgi:hypothetical protein
MTKLKAIIEDFKTPPVAVKSANVKPAKVTHVQSRTETKRAMATARSAQ